MLGLRMGPRALKNLLREATESARASLRQRCRKERGRNETNQRCELSFFLFCSLSTKMIWMGTAPIATSPACK